MTRCMSWSSVGLACLVQLAAAAVLLGASGGDPAAGEIVRQDWYFRESLVAIDDWEAVLAWWESRQPASARTPIWPVPSNGSPVPWLNPIPGRLVPAFEAAERVTVRAVADGIEVQRAGAGGAVDRSTVREADAVPAYRHPGGGGSSRWYHHYHRRFDAMTTFQPRPAPFSVAWAAGNRSPQLQLEFGTQQIQVRLRNVTAAPLPMAVTAKFFHRSCSLGDDLFAGGNLRQSRRGEAAEVALGQSDVVVPAHGEQTISFPLQLFAPGGGLVVVTAATGDQSYWLPILTHVPDAPAVLAGIAQILADTPDPTAAQRWEELCQNCRRLLAAADQPSSNAWDALFVQACRLRDELLLRRIDFDRLLFVKRQPFDSEQPFMDAHHCYNPPGGAIFQLSPVRPDAPASPVVDGLGLGIYRDLCLRWDAQRLLFAFGNGADRAARGSERQGKLDYDLYEAAVDGTGLRQLTNDPKNDCEPFYLPNGQIGFTSDRAEHIVMCGSDIHVASLHVMDGDARGVRQLGFNVFNEFNPALLPDGRIVYDRWEYNERSVTSLHKLFTIHPDGTHAAPYYGNATIRPNVIMFPRPVPGSHKLMALFTGHHGQTHGPIGLIDQQRGLDGPSPISVLTPGVPTIGERIEDSRWGWYGDPRPLSESTYLCTYTPTVLPWLANSWAIYVGDQHGNLALVYRDPAISCAEPIPVVAQPRPATLLPADAASASSDARATLLLMDVYRGLPGVPRGTAHYLRILEDVPRINVPTGGVICTSGTPIYTVKRIVGTVPVETDGSAHFQVPANRNLYFEVLDANRREIQRMRSVVCLKPNENRTCVGCHEPQTTAPPNLAILAAARSASQPQPPPWGDRPISYLRDIQPVIDRHCAQCHAHDRAAQQVILTNDFSDQFTIAYEELLPFLSVANAMRWDNPADVYAQPPYTYGSNASPLVSLLLAGHHGVSLNDEEWERLVNWIDANAVYYDRYETDPHNRRIFPPVRPAMDDVYARRCAACHGKDNDGRRGTWWLSLHRGDVRSSRALTAPLARQAGGQQRCGQAVFPDANDPDYQTLLKALTRVRAALDESPRADLQSLTLAVAAPPADGASQ